MTDIPQDIGPLRNQRHEMFCRAVAGGTPQGQAYRQAGYTGNDGTVGVNASKLMDRAEIKRRLTELTEAKAGFVLTKEWLVGQMVDIAQEAKSDKIYPSSIRALELLGREKGAFTEQREYTVRSITAMSSEEIEGMLAELEAQRAVSARTSKAAANSGGQGRAGKAKATGRAKG